jgi:hypothetical protein
MLPKEVVSLMAHIELNRVGWWDKGICELIKAYLWLKNEPLTKDEIFDGIQQEFSTDVEFKRFEKQVISMVDNKQLLLVSGKYKLSEELYQELDSNSKACEEFTARVKVKFEDILKRFSIDSKVSSEDIWDDFNSTFLIPLVREMGVRVFESITDDHSTFYNNIYFDNFLDEYDLTERPKLREAIEDFLNPKDAEVRSYVLDYLRAYLLVESNKLDENSVGKIQSAMEHPYKLAVFVDTNFLFYLLKLDGGDYGKTSDLLLSLAENSKNRLDMKLYVLPITIEEAQERITQEIKELSTIRNIPSLVNAAGASTLMSGIRQQYFTRIAGAKHNIQASKYFEPYLKSMPTMLRQNGVELFNEKIDHIKSKPEFLNDLTNQIEYERKSKGNGKPKRENALRHDLLLWHFCDEKRSLSVSKKSTTDTQYWIVTVDYRSVTFDKFKQKQRDVASEMCIFPSTLVSMLQFWTPRTPEFEEAVISSIRPLLSRGFDTDSERVTIEILATLSRFEDIGDVSEDTIMTLLTDEGMRTRISQSNAGVDKDTEQLIKDTLASQLEEKSRREKLLAEEVEKKAAELTTVKVELQAKDRQKAKLSSEKAQLSEQLQDRDRKIETLADSDLQQKQRIESLEGKLHRREAHDQFTSFIRNRLIVPTLLILPLAWVLGNILAEVIPFRISPSALSAIIFGILMYLILSTAERRGRELEHIAETKVILWIGRLKLLIAPVLAFIVSIASDLIASLIQLR